MSRPDGELQDWERSVERALREKVETLTEALAFYALPENQDGGSRARKALGIKEKEEVDQ